MAITELKEKIRKTFPMKQAKVLEEVVNLVDETVKVKDFNELKAIVQELAIAQKELAEAQKRTEKRVEELAEAQKRTEKRVEELAIAQKKTEEEVRKLTIGLNLTRSELGGLSRTMSYAFENEAFRMLPKILKERFNIEIKEKFVREEIGGKEINIFARGRKNGTDVIVLGESKLRLREKREIDEVFQEIDKKVEAVKREYRDIEIVRLLITHYATKSALKRAKQKGIIVIQSFEW